MIPSSVKRAVFGQSLTGLPSAGTYYTIYLEKMRAFSFAPEEKCRITDKN